MHKLIAHVLLQKDDTYLVIKRSKIKRGEPNSFAEYWDIPGGTVEENEFPQSAVIREAFEEVNQVIKLSTIIHEDSNYDQDKNAVFTRLVYKGKVKNNYWQEIILDKEEHSEYRFIKNLSELTGEKIVPYLKEIFEGLEDL